MIKSLGISTIIDEKGMMEYWNVGIMYMSKGSFGQFTHHSLSALSLRQAGNNPILPVRSQVPYGVGIIPLFHYSTIPIAKRS